MAFDDMEEDVMRNISQIHVRLMKIVKRNIAVIKESLQMLLL